MLKDVAWPEDRTYLNHTSKRPYEFYLNALMNSNRFDLLLGYFSSAAISVLATGFAKFIFSGGKVRIIANNILGEKDADLIKKSENISEQNYLFDLSNLKSLEQTFDKYDRHFFSCLA